MSVLVATEAWLKDKGDGPKNDIPVPVACCSKPFNARAEAIQVTELNRIAVISWLNSRQKTVRAAFAKSGIMLVAYKERKPRIAHVGDWVVYTLSGEVYVVQQQLFRHLFVVTGLPTAGRKK